MTDQPLTVVSIVIPAEKLGAFFELVDPDWNATSFTDSETDECRVEVFLEDANAAPAAGTALVKTAALLGLKVFPALSKMAREDWAEGWKRYFHVEKISRRLVVRPSWEKYTPKAGEKIITLDPGLSFGTGKHPTTQGCLRYLDDLAEENASRTVRDMGCGTGILSIGAKLLGFRDVQAFDIEPDCVRVTAENARLNAVSFPVELGDLSKPWPQTDIVVANILAPILIQFAAQVAASVAPSGRLILSGILDEQYPAVRQAYAKQGRKELSSLLLGEWRTALFA